MHGARRYLRALPERAELAGWETEARERLEALDARPLLRLLDEAQRGAPQVEVATSA